MHGCFPVDDLIHVEIAHAEISVVDAEVKLEGGAFEWFLESLLTLMLPVIKYIANDYIVETHDIRVAENVNGAFEDCYKMWKEMDHQQE